MADFSTPFADSGDRRLPSTDEKNNGFPCGPADKDLFNALFHRLESEVGHVMDFAGTEQTNDNFEGLRKAIAAMIAADTGSGDTSQFLLVSQARNRLPFYPQIDSADNKMNVSSPSAGTVRIPSGVNFTHRGVYQETTAETDFATSASKTYHVRWIYGTGYELKDLADDVGYNPSVLAETDSAFDSTHDDMLIARVVTDSSNVATITNLANAVNFSHVERFSFAAEAVNNWTEQASTSVTLDWARTPDAFPALQFLKGTGGSETGSIGGGQSDYQRHNLIRGGVKTQTDGVNRYTLKNVLYQYEDSTANNGRINFTWNARA